MIADLAEKLEDFGYFCPFSKHPHSIGESCNMVEYDNEGNGLLPDYCTLRGYENNWGEYDEDCDGARDGKSCWLHYYGTVCSTPTKYTPKRRKRPLRVRW